MLLLTVTDTEATALAGPDRGNGTVRENTPPFAKPAPEEYQLAIGWLTSIVKLFKPLIAAPGAAVNVNVACVPSRVGSININSTLKPDEFTFVICTLPGSIAGADAVRNTGDDDTWLDVPVVNVTTIPPAPSPR